MNGATRDATLACGSPPGSIRSIVNGLSEIDKSFIYNLQTCQAPKSCPADRFIRKDQLNASSTVPEDGRNGKPGIHSRFARRGRAAG
jgi:hypothetical protein